MMTTETFDYDGGWHATRLNAALTDAGVTSTMLVGVHGLADDRQRLLEYSPSFDADRFAAHEKFFVEDVRQRMRSEYGLTLGADRTAIWGASIGAEVTMAERAGAHGGAFWFEEFPIMVRWALSLNEISVTTRMA